jgi:type VI protein secretion system component VasK
MLPKGIPIRSRWEGFKMLEIILIYILFTRGLGAAIKLYLFLYLGFASIVIMGFPFLAIGSSGGFQWEWVLGFTGGVWLLYIAFSQQRQNNIRARATREQQKQEANLSQPKICKEEAAERQRRELEWKNKLDNIKIRRV